MIAKTDPPMLSVVAALAARVRGAMLVNWLQDLFPENPLPRISGGQWAAQDKC